MFDEKLKKHEAYLLRITEVYEKTNWKTDSKYVYYVFIEVCHM